MNARWILQQMCRPVRMESTSYTARWVVIENGVQIVAIQLGDRAGGSQAEVVKASEASGS